MLSGPLSDLIIGISFLFFSGLFFKNLLTMSFACYISCRFHGLGPDPALGYLNHDTNGRNFFLLQLADISKSVVNSF